MVGLMTEPNEEAPAARVVQFMGRDFAAVLPEPEQILVWKRTMDRLKSHTGSWSGEQALAALDRIRKIIDSILTPADIDWLDDQMLQRDPETGRSRFTLENAHGLLMAVITEFQINNREDRREAAKATKAAPARRRPPAKKAAAKKATRGPAR
jgi:hypothetical protein